MTGLDKIIEQIGAEAGTAAQETIAAANRQAQQAAKTAAEQATGQCALIQRQSKSDVTDMLDRAKSAAALQKRKAVLSAKQQIIGEIIENAHRSLYDLPDDQYFEILLKMIKKYALPQNGVILFSPMDFKRLPKDFQNSVNAELKDENASLLISTQTRAIDGGFVLVYGGIEQNCSFSALFDSARESLQDKVHKMLFS